MSLEVSPEPPPDQNSLSRQSHHHSPSSSSSSKRRHRFKYALDTQAQKRLQEWNSYAHSASQPSAPSYFQWRSAAEIKIMFWNLPVAVDTKQIWDWFSKEGELSSIDIFRDSNGARRTNGSGCVRFSPPPPKPFWEQNGGRYTVLSSGGNPIVVLRLQLSDQQNNHYQAASGGKVYPQKLLVQSNALGFGIFTDTKQINLMQQCFAVPEIPIVFELDLKFRELAITFPFPISTDGHFHYRLKFSQTDPMRVWQIPTPGSTSDVQVSLVVALDIVPAFSVQYGEETTHSSDSLTWSRRHSWNRITDLLPEGCHVASSPTSLRKSDSLINLARWNVYRLDFDLGDQSTCDAYHLFCAALRDHNTAICEDSELSFGEHKLEPIWAFIDGSKRQNQAPSSALAELQLQESISLPFTTRYQLEVCFSERLLNEYTLTKDFVRVLTRMKEAQANTILEDICIDGEPVYDPLNRVILSDAIPSPRFTKLPHYCTYVRSAIVTPTTIYYTTPTVEISNRVLRRYSQYGDRFLRVRFTEERPRGKLFPPTAFSNGRTSLDNVYGRIENTMLHGIDIGSRHYDFLAYGNSQFRENGAYFFASTQHVNVQEIRRWMGDVQHIRSVSKYAARLGQCFSTTKVIRGVNAQLVQAHDIETADGKYVFTDGVGKISNALAQMAAGETGVLLPDGSFPSMLQFRLGGCKGVLTVHHEPGLRIHMRPSQYKFHAEYRGLEVIRWSSFTAAHLNRQFIAVLSTLGVPDSVFITKAEAQITDLNAAMIDEKVALKCLKREVDLNRVTEILARLIGAGFQRSQEPFVMNMLQLWRAFGMNKLKESARITIPTGACLLGGIDEFGVLRGHFNPRNPSNSDEHSLPSADQIPEVFVQLSKGSDGKPEVVTGLMLLGRHPSLHPGDIRVVKGVDHPALRHLKDIVILPKTGDRDLASMCSGGDLDGDEFVVFWDQKLLPKERNVDPMDYTAAPELRKESGVTIEDVVAFFVTYMKNNALSDIAMAHLALADRSPYGVRDPKCLQLATLHSQAVDYPKSGRPAQMPFTLRPREWPHYMVSENSNKKVYRSRTVLGKLYDLVDRVDFAPRYYGGFNKQILESYPSDLALLDTASELKHYYDAAVRRIMAQYDICSELEIWSAFVLQHNKRVTSFKLTEVIGDKFASIRDTFREQCYEAAGDRQFNAIGPLVAAMYTVTCYEVRDALGFQANHIAPTTTLPPVMISFPWLFPEVLIRLAGGVSSRGAFTPAEAIFQTEVSRARTSADDGTRRLSKELERPMASEEDVLETDQGQTRRGEELHLFEDTTELKSSTEKLIDIDDDLSDDCNGTHNPGPSAMPLPGSADTETELSQNDTSRTSCDEGRSDMESELERVSPEQLGSAGQGPEVQIHVQNETLLDALANL